MSTARPKRSKTKKPAPKADPKPARTDIALRLADIADDLATIADTAQVIACGLEAPSDRVDAIDAFPNTMERYVVDPLRAVIVRLNKAGRRGAA